MSKKQNWSGPGPSRQECIARDKAIEAARIGSTVMQSYTNGRQERVTQYGTAQQVVQVIREAWAPGPVEALEVAEPVQIYDNPGFFACYEPS